MNEKELREFLMKFDIDSKIIDDYFKGKKINSKFGNLYLTKGEFLSEELIMIKLRKSLISKYILKFILDNNGNKLIIENEKRALDFTYGKDLFLDHTKTKLKDNKYYLVMFNDQILGYSEKSSKNILNLMNIGDYLRE